SALERNSSAARAMSAGYSSKNPGPPEGGVPARYTDGSESSDGVVIQAYQSEWRSSHSSADRVGQPISAWKPAMAVPEREPEGTSPRAHAASAAAMIIPLFMLPACREKLEPASAGFVEVLLPAFAARSERDDPAGGFIERADGRGSRVAVSWDIDARPGPVSEPAARAASGLASAE